ncbi:protein TIFY 6B isoform X2 [Andrographis paniculata]|nr:protein TIFY 6B isoform X2 [Andrographis paniculata]
MHWPFSSKGSSVPQLLSFDGAGTQDTSFDSSTGLVSLASAETFDSDHRPYTFTQKSVGFEKQGGVPFAATTYPSKPNHCVVTGQTNLAISPVVGVPLSNPVIAMGSSPVVGTTDLRNASKTAGGSSQLTIFYNGTVCVYDSISPEKAQAIMLLAGNGPTITSPAAPVQAPFPWSSISDAFVSQPYSTSPHHLSPVLVSSPSVSQFATWSGANNDKVVSSSKASEPAPMVGHTTFISSGTVPQSRRRSLARFLEKRKERVTGVLPYAEEKSADCNTAAGGSSGPRPVVPAVI